MYVNAISGDTLFIAGCGRFFEGTADQMYNNLYTKLGTLPDNTVDYSIICTFKLNLNLNHFIDGRYDTFSADLVIYYIQVVVFFTYLYFL